jgi:hypothetical protein
MIAEGFIDYAGFYICFDLSRIHLRRREHCKEGILR